MHAELRIGNTVVMIADAGGEWPAFLSWVRVYVDDVDATYRRAISLSDLSPDAASLRRACCGLTDVTRLVMDQHDQFHRCSR